MGSPTWRRSMAVRWSGRRRGRDEPAGGAPGDRPRGLGVAGGPRRGENETADMGTLGDREIRELDTPTGRARASLVVLEEASHDRLDDPDGIGEGDPKRFIHR